MGYSIFLAKVIGLYLTILSGSMLINGKNCMQVINDLVKTPVSQFIIGLYLVIIGCWLVTTHNLWINSWVVAITIISWLILIKGVLYLAFPKVIQFLAKPYLKSKKRFYIAATINLAIGLLLFYVGSIAYYN